MALEAGDLPGKGSVRIEGDTVFIECAKVTVKLLTANSGSVVGIDYGGGSSDATDTMFIHNPHGVGLQITGTRLGRQVSFLSRWRYQIRGWLANLRRVGRR